MQSSGVSIESHKISVWRMQDDDDGEKEKSIDEERGRVAGKKLQAEVIELLLRAASFFHRISCLSGLLCRQAMYAKWQRVPQWQQSGKEY